MKHLAFASALLAVGIAQSQPVRWESTLAAIERAVSASARPATVVAITDREKTLRVFAHGYGDIKARNPISADSLFAIGSISKSSTAIALMQLWEEKRFDPDVPFAKFLPWFTIKSSFAQSPATFS
jgi:D-alanyl-D-alanine carboxypeptidase